MRKNILILFFIVAMISCDKKEGDLTPIVDNCPMTVGTEWTYEFQQIVKKYETATSDQIMDIDTMNSIVKVWIDKDTLLNDTLNVKAFKSRFNDHIWTTSTEYKFIDNQGLKTYAYSDAISEIDIIFEEKPTLDIEFPLNKNSFWTCKQSTESNTLQIDKEVIGTEILSLFGQNYTCYKVKSNYFCNTSHNDIGMSEWFSKKGLIKRLTVHDRSIFPVENEPLYFGTLTETLTLKELNIK